MIWRTVAERASEVAAGRDAVRVANLCVAAQIAARQGRFGRHDSLSGAALAEAIYTLALSEIAVHESRPAWDLLASDSREAAVALCEGTSMDAWVQAFQGGDAARKSRGAYATPQQLALPMARLLLRAPALPNRIIDPAAGAGGLLVAVLRELRRIDPSTNPADHARRLYGVELDPVARELCCLFIWLECDQQLDLGDIARNVVVDNAITRDWWSEAPYKALIMNPPWDSLRHATSNDVDTELQRTATLTRLSEARPGAPGLPPLYTAHGRGDRNLYKAFLELAPHLLEDGSRLVALIPGAWSSDLGTRELRRAYLDQLAIEQWTSFENLNGYFPIDGRYKFGVLTATRSATGSSVVSIRAFASDARAVFDQHVATAREDLDEVGGAASTIPDITSEAELKLMLKFTRAGIPFFANDGPLGKVRYSREIDLTLDRKAGLFRRTEDVAAQPRGDGAWVTETGDVLVPLLEGRMVGPYDFHQKSWVAGSGRTAQWTYANGSRLGDCKPQYLINPTSEIRHRVAICDVTSATNTRTVLATWVPPTWRCGNTAPALVFDSERSSLAAVAVLNSMVFDWLVRRVVAGLHLNRFYLEALCWPCLNEDDVNILASVGAMLQQLNPRYLDLAAPKISESALPTPYVEAHSIAESTVARGYGLDRDDLMTIYCSDQSDRRGFWRHFATDPHATAIAGLTLERFTGQGAAGGLIAPVRQRHGENVPTQLVLSL